MAYSNPILGAVQSSEAARLQNKQFEASLGLQIAQFAENKANTKKDQTYRQDVLGENKRATGVAEAANAALVDLEAERFKGAKPQRDANLALTNSQAGAQDASAAVNTAAATAQQFTNQQALLKNEGGLWWQHMMNADGTDKKLDNPETQEFFGAIINQPGISKLLLTGSDGTAYKFKGAVDAGNGRRAIQITDPNNPDKVMYMSKDRTAVESDPLTSMDLMSFDILKSQVSIALHQADGRPLTADLQAAADGMNAIRQQPQNTPILLDNQTIQQSAELSEQMQVDQAAQQQPKEQPKAQKLGTSRTDVGPYENGVPTETAIMDPSNHDLSTYSWDQLNSLTDSQWDTALESSEERLQTMLDRPVVFGNVDKMIERNNKTIASVQKRIDEVDGEVPDGLQGQMQLLNNNSKRLDARKAAGNDTVDAAQKAHNDLLSAKEVADGKKPAPTAIDKAATNIVKKAEIDPRQSKKPELAAAVEKEIVANPPPIEQVAQALSTPQKVTPGMLYQLHTAKALGLIDQTSLQTALDLGVFSQSAVDLMKQQLIEAGELTQTQMNNENGLLKEAMKIAGDAGKPKYNTTADGTVQALDSKTGNVLWEHKPGADQNDGRSQAAIMEVVEQHNDEGKNGLDIYDSVVALSNNYNVTEMPMLEQNLLSQNLNQVLYEELGVNAFNSFIDWFEGSDEDQASFGPFDYNKFSSLNPMEKVTTRFALSADGTITMYDQYGVPHGDRDYKLTDIGDNAVQKALSKILKTPTQVEENLIPRRLEAMQAELAQRQAALGDN